MHSLGTETKVGQKMAAGGATFRVAARLPITGQIGRTAEGAMLHLLSALAPVLGSPVLAPAPRDAFVDATRVPGSCDKSVPPTSKSVSLDAELYFINLESRPDRKVHLIEQLESVGYDKTHD